MNIDQLIKDNAARWDAMTVNAAVVGHAQKIAAALSVPQAKSRYQEVEHTTGVPWAVVAVIHERECSQSWLASLAQGDPWDKPSIHVPKGVGPFTSWEDAAVYAITKCAPHLGDWKDWSAGGMLTILERYNGLGYYYRKVPSPYLWAGTNQYLTGKFIADGHYDPSAVDKQIGCAVLLKLLNSPTADAKPVVETKPPVVAVTTEKTMNPISLMMTVFSLAQTVAPLLPDVVGDVKTFVNDMEKIVGDISKLDGTATLADVQKLFSDIQTDLPTVTKVIAASKGIAL